VRGAITLAGVMSIPLALSNGMPFPGRDLAIFLAAGVIICSLLAASFALPLIVRGLELPSDDPHLTEARTARGAAAAAAIARIGAQIEAIPGPADLRSAVAERMIANYRLRLAAVEEGNASSETAREASRIERELRLAAIAAERETLRAMFDQRKIGDETINRLAQDLALTEAMLRRSPASGV
jgi:CPA1 family monovalent cation:H+ antiporter